MRKPNLAAIAVVMVAIPTVYGCSASSGSNPCSSANQRALEASMSSVEKRANVTSLGAIGPSCDSGYSNRLIAQRTYRSVKPVEDALESALSANGWASKRTPEGDLYLGQLRNGRLTYQVELTTVTVEENGQDGFVLQANFDSLTA